MEKERKEELLKIIATFEKKLKSYDSTSFIAFLATTSKTYYLEKKPVEEYFKFMFYTGLQAKKVLGGGNAATEGYKKFLKEELKITKRNENIIVNHTQLASMSMEEIAYVFGWLRRVLVDKDAESKSRTQKSNAWNDSRNNNRNYSNTQNRNYKGNSGKQTKEQRNTVYQSQDDVREDNVFANIFKKH